MATSVIANGKPRKQLADQLDRLDAQMERQDAILDALSEGLNGAVGDAARQGVREAVAEAVVTLLSDPSLRSALHKASADARPTLWERLCDRARAAKAKALDLARRATSRLKAKAAEAKAAAADLAGPAVAAWRLRKIVLVGLAVGAGVAGLSYVASHGFAAAASGVGAATAAVALNAAGWLRTAVRRLAGG